MSYGPPRDLDRCTCGCVRADHFFNDPRDAQWIKSEPPCQGCGPDCRSFEIAEPDLCGLCGVQVPRPGFTACRSCAG